MTILLISALKGIKKVIEIPNGQGRGSMYQRHCYRNSYFRPYGWTNLLKMILAIGRVESGIIHIRYIPVCTTIMSYCESADLGPLFFMELAQRGEALCPEGSENIPILFQGADLYFSNQNNLRNPKMGSKQSVTDATEWVFFQITFFGTKNHQKNDIFEL